MARLSKDHLYLFLEHNVEVATKTIYIGYGATEDMDLDHKVAADVLKGLHILSSIKPDEPINIIINNQGGETQHGLAIYDKIRSMSSTVTITVYGHCYSIGAWILQAGDIRRMSKNSSLMIHHGSGDKTQFDKEMDQKCFDILLKRIREKKPDYTAKQLDKLLLKDTYLWPEQALELGLIDEVLEDE
jgi:ATP-dependent Clp protease protease subunit